MLLDPDACLHGQGAQVRVPEPGLQTAGERLVLPPECKELLVRSGKRGVKLTNLGKVFFPEAGITKPILYRHFGHKGGLYAALAEPMRIQHDDPTSMREGHNPQSVVDTHGQSIRQNRT